MIGVLCADIERKVVQEFFELFKTPWEFYEPDQDYDVILSTLQESPEAAARLIIIFSSKRTQFDEHNGLIVDEAYPPLFVQNSDVDCPIYGDLSTVQGKGKPMLYAQSKSKPIAVAISESSIGTIRVGYNLFREIDFLLSEGQPVENASIPTLDIHISLLRGWIIASGIPLVEIPPTPLGHRFFSCLTHDIDFVGIRKHKFDNTLRGFIFRALFGSLFAVFRGEIGLKKLMANWIAVIKLPFVFVGMASDFWEHFDRYADVDQGFGSTYFLIPFKNKAGVVHLNHEGPSRRGTPYEIGEVKKQVLNLIERGREIGVHGIDAWCNSESGSQELQQVLSATGQEDAGIRMHWLYYDNQTAHLLEQAGFKYDASLGYNNSVGFKNGTLQVFKPLNVNGLLEIPLAIQDTSLFYPRRLNLTTKDASKLCNSLLVLAECYGGVLTLSWHDRSLEPERLWGDFYIELLEELRVRNAWVGNAYQITEWFRRRRSISFNGCTLADGNFEINLSGDYLDVDPRLFIRLHIPSQLQGPLMADHCTNIIDMPWSGETSFRIFMADKEIA